MSRSDPRPGNPSHCDLYDPISDTSIRVEEPTTQDIYLYPKEIFQGRPKIDIVGKKMSEIRENLKSEFIAAKFTVELVNQFLWAGARKIKDQLTEDWISFGIKIGEKDKDICISDLLLNTNENGYITDTEPLSELDKGLLVICCFGLRYGRANAQNMEYTKNLATRMNDIRKSFMPNDDGELDGIDNLRNSMESVCNTYPFSALVSAYDMFFNKFQKNEFFKFRFGSIAARWKDCSIIPLMVTMKQNLNMTLKEVLTWIMVPGAKKEIKRIIAPDNEISKDDSYTPYCAEYIKTGRVPYSNTANPNFSMIFLSYLALMGKKRGINAFVVDEAEWPAIRQNVVLLVFICDTNVPLEAPHIHAKDSETQAGLIRQYQQWKSVREMISESERSINEDVPSATPELEPPKTKNPMDWFMFYEANGQQWTSKMYELTKKYAQNIENVRPNTVGHYIKTMWSI